MTPTNRSVKYLKALGATVEIVERQIPKTFIKRDFFSFADLIYVLGVNVVAVQVTSGNGGNHANRKAKILAEPKALIWLKAGLIELHSWRKNAAGNWILRQEEIVEADFAPQTEVANANPD